jgi:hypothetical protein
MELTSPMFQACMARGIHGLNRARHAQPFYTLRVGHPRSGLTVISGVARPHGPFGYPTPHGLAHDSLMIDL